MRIGRWSELRVDRVCQEHEVLREVDANEISGELGSAFGGTQLDCLVFEAEQGSQVQSLFLRYCAAFKSPEHFACTHPVHLVHR